METTIEKSPILQKTMELCQAILEQPEMRSARKNIETFLSDEKARAHYDGVMAKGQALQEKQQRSMPLTGEEIAAFERDRDALSDNPVAKNFLEAQDELHHVHTSVNQYVSKTLELGHLPTEADLNSGDGCGHDCGCGHSH